VENCRKPRAEIWRIRLWVGHRRRALWPIISARRALRRLTVALGKRSLA
jgi:hypothetical protein